MKLRYKSIFLSFASLTVFCGCMSSRTITEAAPGAIQKPDALESNITEKTEQDIITPASGFTWNELARIAALRNSESQLLALSIKRDFLQNKAERSWRNPQLRLKASDGKTDEYSTNGSSQHENSDANTVGLRFYISNPFVNHWIKKQSTKSAALLTTSADELAYATYCETKTQCLESAIISDQISQIRRSLKLQQRICSEYKTLIKDGYIAPLKIIKAEIKLAEIELKLSQKEHEHSNRLYQLALLTGLTLEQLQLQPLDSQTLSSPDSLNIDDLTAFAILCRPDLKRVRSEIDFALTDIKIAEAKMIPWFEYAEGAYRDTSSDSVKYNNPGQTYSDEDGDEWYVRTGINIPIFSWMGDEVILAKASLNEAQLQEVILLNSIREEIQVGVKNYNDAYQSKSHFEERVNEQLKSFEKQIRDVNSTKTIIAPEILNLEEQLCSYKQSVRENLYTCLKMKLYLESVVGGTELK
jgi:outer membrane protein TolC